MFRGAVLIGVVALMIFMWSPPAAAGESLDSKTQRKRIVFIAGPKDHGGPGAHEYEKDLRLLKRCLDTSPGIKGLSTAIHVGRAPRDIRELKDAATIVIHSSGDRLKNETHALFPLHDEEKAGGYTEEDEKFLRQLDRLMKQGTGIVVLHYSLIVETPKARSYFLDWIGGYHHSGQSQVRIDRSEAQPATPGHPILRGVKPWTTDHEYYFNQYFRKDDKRVVPILTSMLPSTDPKRHVIAWAVERDGGGRGFAFTGGHYDKNMLVEDYRRMLLNAILWTAGVDVPEGGVTSTVSPGTSREGAPSRP